MRTQNFTVTIKTEPYSTKDATGSWAALQVATTLRDLHLQVIQVSKVTDHRTKLTGEMHHVEMVVQVQQPNPEAMRDEGFEGEAMGRLLDYNYNRIQDCLVGMFADRLHTV